MGRHDPQPNLRYNDRTYAIVPVSVINNCAHLFSKDYDPIQEFGEIEEIETIKTIFKNNTGKEISNAGAAKLSHNFIGPFIQTSLDTLRKSNDGTKCIVKYRGPQPVEIYAGGLVETKEFTHSEMLQYLKDDFEKKLYIFTQPLEEG